MPGHHPVVTLPHLIPGGVSFTIDELDHGPMVFVSDAALKALAPEADAPVERLAYVLQHAGMLAGLARDKLGATLMPELIVLEPEDVTAPASTEGNRE